MLSGLQEVKDLTFHFSQMIRTIRDFNKDLQIKIDKKTRELKRANEELEELATHDPLTGYSIGVNLKRVYNGNLIAPNAITIALPP